MMGGEGDEDEVVVAALFVAGGDAAESATRIHGKDR
jgi:hypothetical protein